jgi:hypothetical protein
MRSTSCSTTQTAPATGVIEVTREIGGSMGTAHRSWKAWIVSSTGHTIPAPSFSISPSGTESRAPTQTRPFGPVAAAYGYGACVRVMTPPGDQRASEPRTASVSCVSVQYTPPAGATAMSCGGVGVGIGPRRWPRVLTRSMPGVGPASTIHSEPSGPTSRNPGTCAPAAAPGSIGSSWIVTACAAAGARSAARLTAAAP